MVCVGPGRALWTHANFPPFSVPPTPEQLHNTSMMTSRPIRRLSFVSHSVNKQWIEHFPISARSSARPRGYRDEETFAAHHLPLTS
jgi:hypothetical protein